MIIITTISPTVHSWWALISWTFDYISLYHVLSDILAVPSSVCVSLQDHSGCDLHVPQWASTYKPAPCGLTQWLTQTQTAATRQGPASHPFVIVTPSPCYQPTRRRGAEPGTFLLENYCCAALLTAASIVLFASPAERWDGSSPCGHTEISQP